MLYCIGDVKRKQTNIEIQYSRYNIDIQNRGTILSLQRLPNRITKIQKKKYKIYKTKTAQYNKKSNKYIIEVKCSCIIKQIKKLLKDL